MQSLQSQRSYGKIGDYMKTIKNDLNYKVNIRLINFCCWSFKKFHSVSSLRLLLTSVVVIFADLLCNFT